MKFLQVGISHSRNEEFMKRACSKFGIEYHHTYSTDFPDANYDIIWCPGTWINPDKYPLSKFIFGPQFWTIPDINHPFFTESKPEHAKRCVFTCLSNWNKECYNEFVDLSTSNIPFVTLPFGLDIKESIKNDLEYDCIIYVKRRNPSLVEHVKSVIEKKSLLYKVFTYGYYDYNDYINTLRKTRFVIWIGSHESQGFGVQECLATGTPILVYDVNSMKDECDNNHFTYIHLPQKMLATTVPYWDSRCGMTFKTNDEFTDILGNFLENLDVFRPSEYINETLSDEICFKRFLDTLNITL